MRWAFWRRGPRNSKEFSDMVIAHVRRRAPSWRDHDVKEWLRSLHMPKFGAAGHDWSARGAEALADEFLNEGASR